MALDPSSRARFNLSSTVVLLFDPNPIGMAILVQIITGLGARRIHRCSTVDEAKAVVAEMDIDLMIVDGVAESGEGYAFVRWLRKEAPEPNKHTTVLLTAGHTGVSDVSKARDCGGNYIIAKPIAPIVMLERIIWIAREGRAFVLSDGYVGPDRRFGKPGQATKPRYRRRDDKSQSDEPAPAPQAQAEKDDGLSTPDAPRKAAS